MCVLNMIKNHWLSCSWIFVAFSVLRRLSVTTSLDGISSLLAFSGPFGYNIHLHCCSKFYTLCLFIFFFPSSCVISNTQFLTPQLDSSLWSSLLLTYSKAVLTSKFCFWILKIASSWYYSSIRVSRPSSLFSRRPLSLFK